MKGVDTISFALVGCGNIAQRHAAHIAAKGRLAGVCDIIKEKADALAAAYQVKTWYSIDDLLAGEKDIDVVAICTPNGLHAEHSIKALEAGYHVLCEKPMAIKASDCAMMIAAAEKAGRRLFIIKQNRYNPPVVAVKQAVDAGRLGKINSLQLNCFWNRDEHYYKNSAWKGTQNLDGGTLFTQFSHFIDLLYWMLGDIEKVQAFTGNYTHDGIIEFEDTGGVILQFANGAIGTINYTVNSFEKNMEGSLTLFGERGTVKIGGQYLNELEYQHIQDYIIENLPAGNPPNHYGSYEGSMSNHGKVYDNVIDVLQNNAPHTTSAFEGLKTVEIIEKIYAATDGL